MMGEGDEFWQHKQASGNLNCLVDIWCLWWAQIIINNGKSRAHCYSLLLPLHLSFSPFVGYSVVLYSLISSSYKTTVSRIQENVCGKYIYIFKCLDFSFCYLLLTRITCTHHLCFSNLCILYISRSDSIKRPDCGHHTFLFKSAFKASSCCPHL